MNTKFRIYPWLLLALLFLACTTKENESENPHEADDPEEVTKPYENPRVSMGELMGINGHFTFKPELYKQVCRKVRNYHNLNWDVTALGNAPDFPNCPNGVNWKTGVYGPWKASGFETDICVQFSGFQPGTPHYETLWKGKEAWIREYGLQLARYFGPSGKEKLCTSVEIGNEPSAKFDMQLFKTIFVNMASGLREGDPKLKIATPAVAANIGSMGAYIQDLNSIYKDPEVLLLYDIINLHSYAEGLPADPSPWNRSYPEDRATHFLRWIEEAVAWRDANAPGKEIWVTEFGYDAATDAAMARRTGYFLSLDWQGYTDRQQAQYLVRSYLLMSALDVKRAFLFYYDDKDEASVHAASGITRNFTPKTSFYALQQMYLLLGDYCFNRVVSRDADSYVYEYIHKGDRSRYVWVTWSPTGCRTHTKQGYRERSVEKQLKGFPGQLIRLETMASDLTSATVRKGEGFKLNPDGSLTLKVEESPKYLYFREK